MRDRERERERMRINLKCFRLYQTYSKGFMSSSWSSISSSQPNPLLSKKEAVFPGGGLCSMDPQSEPRLSSGEGIATATSSLHVVVVVVSTKVWLSTVDTGVKGNAAVLSGFSIASEQFTCT